MTDLYFPVEMVPVEDIMPGFEHPSGIDHAIVVTLPDGVKRVVQYCSETYHLVPNEEIVPKFQNEISRFFKVDMSIKIYRWSRFYVDFIMKDKQMMVSTKDSVFPRVRLVNSYDGSVKYQFLVGFWRQVCSNGMMGWKWEGFKAMHTPKLGNETSFEAVMGMTSEFLAEATEMVEIYRELQDNTMDDWMGRIEEVVEETKFPVSMEENVVERMGQELDIFKGTLPNDWLVYNAFNYQVNHNDGWKAKESKKDEIDQEVMQFLMSY